MATFTPCVFQHQKRDDGSYRVSFRITHNRRSVYLKTDVFVVKQQLTRDFRIKDSFLIVKLAEQATTYQKKVLERFGVGQACSAAEIKEYLEREAERQNGNIDFIGFSREYLAGMAKEGREKTAIPIRRSLNAFVDFIGRDKIYFKDITLNLLEDFGKYLQTERKVVRNNQRGEEQAYCLQPLDQYGVSRFYMDLRSLFNAAVKKYNSDDEEELVIKRNPFRKLEIKVKRQTGKRNISIEDIRRIMEMPDDGFVRANLARDVFILSFMLVGMNPVDLYNAYELKDGRINYKRHKTSGRRADEAFISLKVEPEMMPLLEKYRDRSGKRVFDFYKRYSTSDIFDAALNKGLKVVQATCGLSENLTMYVARHSWATIARNKLRIPIDDIAQGLNHVDKAHKTTFIYIQKDFSLIDEANRKMLNLLYLKNTDSSITD